MAKAENLIEIIDPSTIMTEEYAKVLFKLIKNDSFN